VRHHLGSLCGCAIPRYHCDQAAGGGGAG
jgi:hypothetical protein